MNKQWLFRAAVAAGLVALAGGAYLWQHRPAAVVAPADNGGAGKGGQAAKGVGGPVVVEAAAVTIAALADDLQAVGSVRANEDVVLRPEISGRIAHIQFREGQRVRQDEVLIALDDSVPRAELAQAEAQFALARANFERTRDLARQSFVSESALDTAASALKVQEAARGLAQTRLAKSTIRAPFAGVVGVRQVAVGDYVKEGQDMVALQDTATVKVEFRIPERYLAQVRPGQKLGVETDALPRRQFAAKVEFIDPKVDAAARSVLVRGRVPNPDGALRPGMFARVRLVFEEKPRALVVPEEAVVPAAAGEVSANVVYRLVGVGTRLRALRTPVETGLRRDAKVEILSGLAAGDRVVTAGQIKLRGDEAAVQVRAPADVPGTAAPGAGTAERRP